MKKHLVLPALLLLGGFGIGRTPAQTPNYGGSFEVADCNSISGWIEDPNNLNVPVDVNIFSGSTLVAKVLANSPRSDVGLHGFNIRTPLALRDGQTHSLSARGDGSSADILNSPRSMGPCSEVTASVISNPKITSFEIQNGLAAGSNTSITDSTTNPNLNLRVEIDQPDRVHFFRLGEIPCPESVSDRPELAMKNLPWQPYTPAMSFSYRLNASVSQPYGTRCVFMEVNTSQNESSASPAKGDSVVLAPARLKTFTLTGVALRNFLDRAKALGYKFTVTSYSFTPDPGTCPQGTVVNTSSLTKASTGAGAFAITTAKLFDRGDPFLNVFWKMTGIEIPGNGASVTIDGPPSGRADDPFRTVGIKQGFKALGTGGSLQAVNSDTAGAANFSCVAEQPVPGPFDTASITSITIQGPDDKQPEDAFFDPGQPNQRRLLRPLNPRP